LRKLLPIFALVLMLAGLQPSNGRAQVAISSPDYGASVFAFGNPGTSGRDLGLAAGAGLGWVRLDIPWRSVEASCKNCYDWRDLDRTVLEASTLGLKIMARLDRPPAWARAIPAENGPPDDPFDYADFAQQVARRYAPGSPRGTIQAIAVWNEPNLDREWGGPGVIIDRNQASQYMYMLELTRDLVKELSPGTIIVSAGLSPTGTNDGTAQPDDVYLGWLYEEGLAQVADVIGMHGAGFGSPPECNPLAPDPALENCPHPLLPGPWNYFRRVEQLHGIMEAYGDGAKQVWLLEFGWPAKYVDLEGAGRIENPHPGYNFYAVEPQQKADYLVRAYQYAKTRWPGWIGVMFIWNIADPNWTPAEEQFFWSITNPDGTTRPAYTAVANLPKP
jgi:polysaccharide biosynthesis protein PslG